MAWYLRATCCACCCCLNRELYPTLVDHAQYVGIWRETASSSPEGALYSFRWGADGVEVVQLVPTHRYLTDLTQKQLCVLGPSYPRYSAVVLDGIKCVLHDHGSNSHAAAAPCAVAEAAASVAVGGLATRRRSSSGSSTSSSSSGSSGGQDVPAGSSPSGFGWELLRFMQSSVQKVRGCLYQCQHTWCKHTDQQHVVVTAMIHAVLCTGGDPRCCVSQLCAHACCYACAAWAWSILLCMTHQINEALLGIARVLRTITSLRRS